MMGFLLTALVAVAISSDVVNGYAVCGNATYNAKEVDEAIEQTTIRLLQLRGKDWGWLEPFIPTSLQVAAPVRLFGRQHTSAAVTTMIANNFQGLRITELSNFALATKSLCLNPRNISNNNILQAIEQKLNAIPANESGVQPELASTYAFALQALCVNDYTINAMYVDTLLRGQNQDGSFGRGRQSVDFTIFMIGPMSCLTRIKNPTFNMAVVQNALNKMREFVMQQVIVVGDDAYLGFSEFVANEALIALWKSRQPDEDPNIKWSCRKVVDTLGLYPYLSEEGYGLHFRLLRLTGTSFLDLQDKDYKCVDTDPIPEGYKPACDLIFPETCGLPPYNTTTTPGV